MGLGFLTLEDSIDGVLGAGTDAWSYYVAIHSCVAIPHCVGISSCVSVSVKREAVIAGLASEGLALLLGSAEAGSSAVQDIFIFPADALGLCRPCQRSSKWQHFLNISTYDYESTKNLTTQVLRGGDSTLPLLDFLVSDKCATDRRSLPSFSYPPSLYFPMGCQ